MHHLVLRSNIYSVVDNNNYQIYKFNGANIVKYLENLQSFILQYTSQNKISVISTHDKIPYEFTHPKFNIQDSFNTLELH